MQTDTQLEKQPTEYEANTFTSLQSFRSFLKINNIPHSESNGYFKLVPKNDEQVALIKRYCETRKIKLEILGNV
ncbi:MAG: hypothetical protein IPL26_00305 [Leptospiraceae bacterium]|nr:hypothetical protein [Leptospiraceae bacterium]